MPQEGGGHDQESFRHAPAPLNSYQLLTHLVNGDTFADGELHNISHRSPGYALFGGPPHTMDKRPPSTTFDNTSYSLAFLAFARNVALIRAQESRWIAVAFDWLQSSW